MKISIICQLNVLIFTEYQELLLCRCDMIIQITRIICRLLTNQNTILAHGE